MHTYIRQPPASATLTMNFNSYNEAVAFCAGSAILKPSKPFKRLPAGTWHVTLPNRFAKPAASYIRLKTPCKRAVDLEMVAELEKVLAQIVARSNMSKDVAEMQE